MEFDARKIREEQTPPITRTWMAKKMGVSQQFLYLLEFGVYNPWPAERKAQFEKIIADWKLNPEPRQRRSDFGKKHRKRRRKAVVKTEPVPVPHSHGEVVGIG